MTLKRKVRITREHNSDGTHNVVAEATNADTVDNFNASQTVGTANTILVAGSDGTMPIQPIWDYTVTGSAITTATTNGTVTLDGHAHGGYGFEFIILNNSGSNATYRLYYNNDTTAANYNYNVSGGGIAGADAIMSAGTPTGRQLHGKGNLTISPAGLVVSIWPHYRTDNVWYQMYHYKIATVTNLTRIDIVSSVANGIGVNSRFRLFRRI